MKEIGKIIITIAMLLPRMALAQTERVDSTTLRNVEVSAYRVNKNTFTSQPVQEVRHAEMEQLGMTDLADVLRRMAGTNIKDYGGLGGMKTVSVRNMGASHTAVSLDGIPVSNSQAGQIDVGRFNLRHLESVSLAVGHQDELLQPARLFASAAVLSLQSLQPTFLENKMWSLTANCQVGQWGEVNPDLFYQQKIGEGTIITANANYLRSDGRYPFTLVIPNVSTTSEKRFNNDIQQWHAEAGVQQHFKNNGLLDVKMYGYDSQRGLPGHVIYYNLENSRQRLWDRIGFVQAQYKQPLNRLWTLLVQGKANYGYSRYRDEGEEYDAGYMEERYTQREGLVSMAALYKPFTNWSFSLSQDGSINSLRSPMKFCPDPNRYTSLTALNARYEDIHWRVTGTLVGTFITETVKKGGTPDDIKHLSPTLALRYTPSTTLPLNLRAMYKNTFRTPSFNDLYYRSMGSLALKPEDAQELSAGLTLSPSKIGMLRRTSLTIDGYWNMVKNKIVAIPTNFVWTMRNYGKARMGGIDITAQTTIPFGHDISLDISGAYSWMRAIDLTDANKKSYKNQLPYTPRHSGNASALLRTPWLNAGYTVMAVGLRYVLAQNIPANEVQGYQDHTLTLSRNFKLHGCSVKLLGSITNLLDKDYDVVRYYPMPGRAYHLTVEIKI